MKPVYVSRHRDHDPLAAKVLEELGGKKLRQEILLLARNSEDAPSRCVAVVTRPSQPWYMYLYDMRDPAHRSLFENEPVARKSQFVVGIRPWNTSERRFWKSVNRIPALVERALERRRPA
jgi:hypothetical protein